jgi:hypothetical protein
LIEDWRLEIGDLGFGIGDFMISAEAETREEKSKTKHCFLYFNF